MKIEVKDDLVIIDGFEIYGHVDQGKSCSKCKFHLVYYEKYDSYFCPNCNSWTESKCSDPDCEYCQHRPIKPLLQKEN